MKTSGRRCRARRGESPELSLEPSLLSVSSPELGMSRSNASSSSKSWLNFVKIKCLFFEQELDQMPKLVSVDLSFELMELKENLFLRNFSTSSTFA